MECERMDCYETVWNGFRRLNFRFENRVAVLIFPAQSRPGKPWLLKTEYFGAFPDLEIAMLEQGFHVAFVKNTNRWGLREDVDCKKQFRDYLVREYGLAEKCIPVGMSCGGIFSVKLAAIYPQMVSAIYVDAPVVNILSMMAMGQLSPDKMDEAEIIQALSLSRSELLSYREHPLDYLPKLIENRIPACVVYGDADSLVPWEENVKLILDAYQGTDVPVSVFLKQGADHHPHALGGLSDMQQAQMIDFLIKYSL